MPRTVNPLKKAELKKRILTEPKKPVTEILKEMGATKSVIHRSTDNKCVKVCMEEIKYELKQENVTVQLVISRLNEDRELAKSKGDIATMTRADELLGKYLAMFRDRIIAEHKIEFKEDELIEYETLLKNRRN